MPERRPLVPIGWREVWRNPGHCGVQLFIGRNEGARGNSGEITMRTDEWDELQVFVNLHHQAAMEILPAITTLRTDSRTFGGEDE